jgi:biopolymer transport protein ExbD
MHLHDKRAKSADLNLVPYIDLLTCMIAFLLITAVWTQLARLQVRQRGVGDGESNERPTKVVVMVGDGGFNVIADNDRQIVPRRDHGYDFVALKTALVKLKSALPDKDDLVVTSDDDIAFETLVATMDTALSAGFPELSLVDPAAAGL